MHCAPWFCKETHGLKLFIFKKHPLVVSHDCLLNITPVEDSSVLDELFKYSTTWKTWSKVDGARTLPSARRQHSMTAVGHDIYIFGGKTTTLSSGLSDLLVHQASRFHDWTSSFGLSSFTRIYDNDIIRVAHNVDWGFSVDLCSISILPCSLKIVAEGATRTNATLRRLANSTITCDAANDCKGFSLEGVIVACSNQISKMPPLQAAGIGTSITVTDSDFEDCRSEAAGGAILVTDGAVIDVSDSSFKRSSTAMAILGAHASIVDSKFTDCRAPEGQGGALLVQDFPSYPTPVPSTLRLQRCEFARNSANEGGSVAMMHSGEAIIASCIFTANSATQSGGAVAMVNFDQVTISESRFEDNRASGPGGGALYGSLTFVDLAANFFLRNSATEGGGGAFFWNGKQFKMS